MCRYAAYNCKKIWPFAGSFLQQLNYWIKNRSGVGVDHDGRRWVYNTSKEWSEDLETISERTVTRAISILREEGVIITKALNSHKAVRTNYFTIDYDRLFEILDIKGSPPITTPKAQKEYPQKETLVTHNNHISQDMERPNDTAKVAHPSRQNGAILYNDTKITSKNNISLSTEGEVFTVPERTSFYQGTPTSP